MKKIIPLFMLVWLGGCAANRSFESSLKKEMEASPIFSNGFTGFVLFNPATQKTLVDWNGSKRFTPASCTKILTLYTCLRTFGDSKLPSIRWQTDGENFFFQGLGDPSFLHPTTLGRLCPTFDFLKNRPEKNLFFSPFNFYDDRFGAGWAWDDYRFAYQAERAALPIYGGLMSVRGADLTVKPPRFQLFLNPTLDGPKDDFVEREEFGDRLKIYAKAPISPDFKQNIPIFWQNLDFNLFLKDTLGRAVSTPAATFFEQKTDPRGWKTLDGPPLDSLLRAMMCSSDNFLAEQLLMACAARLTDSLAVEKAIAFSKKNYLADLPDEPRWFDGSGLSRYNLLTPRSFVFLLSKIWNEQPHERVFNLFAAGGASGTIADFYKPQSGEPTYVFAKTGTLGGVHCLSGFLLTEHHNVLIFSFMHQNFVGSSKPYKVEMERFLRKIKARF